MAKEQDTAKARNIFLGCALAFLVVTGLMVALGFYRIESARREMSRDNAAAVENRSR